MTAAVITSTARQLLNASREDLLQALRHTPAGRRQKAYDSACETALVVIGIRSREPASTATIASPWRRLTEVAPELANWAEMFDGTVEIHSDQWESDDERAANDLLRYAEAFYMEVEKSLALPYRQVLPGARHDLH